MSAIYNSFMRRAAVLLAILSVLTLVIGLYSALATFNAMRAMAANSPLAGGMATTGVLYSLLTACGLAAVPYFGAALLWRMDRAFAARSGETIA